MAKATWNGVILAESDACEIVEGNHYFPAESVKHVYLRSSTTRTTCPWKGVASYYHIVVDGRENRDAAWCYPDPSERARQIRDHVAFWRGVDVQP